MKNKKKSMFPSVYVLRINGEIKASDGDKSIPFLKNHDLEDAVDFLHDIEMQDDVSDIGGILIRINTPGGSPAMSEEIANMIKKVRAKGVPVIASIGDICCSGGYWIVSACDYVFANKTSLTGSIGVIMMLPNFTGLADKLGVTQETFKAGKMKDIGNPFRRISEDEREFLEGHLKETHKIFIDEVVENRHLDKDNLNEDLFDGRPFSALCAKENNMIDAIGSYHDALAYLLKQIDKKEEDVFIEDAWDTKKKGFLARLLGKTATTLGVSAGTSLGKALTSANYNITMR